MANTELKLSKYTRLTADLNQFVKALNELTLNDTAKHYIDGLPLKDIDTNTVLTAHKFDTASKLPNFNTYLKAGIDLSTQIPDCETTKATVDALVSLIKAFQYNKEKSMFSFDSKAGAFVVNAAGKLALDNAVVKLTPEQETIYDAVQALFTQLATHSDTLPVKMFNDSIVNSFTKALNLDTMVYTITSTVK